MGAQCVKSTQKMAKSSHQTRMGSLQQELRNRDEDLLFTMTIEHLRLTNMTDVIISFIAESKTKNLLTKEYEITVGVASRKGEENLNRNGIAQKVKIQVPTENNTDIISYELMKLTYNLIGQAVANFK